MSKKIKVTDLPDFDFSEQTHGAAGRVMRLSTLAYLASSAEAQL